MANLLFLLLLLAGTLMSSGCSSLVAWRGDVVDAAKPATESTAVATADKTQKGKPERRELAPPSSVRPCCIFGTGLQVDVGEVTVPFVQLDNVVAVNDLGHHQYDNGSSPVGVDDEAGVFASEKNGLIFTCQAGFVDVAHVRDYADWTLYFASQMPLCLDAGCVIALPSEGGERFLVVSALPAAARTEARRRETVIALSRWAAFQLSIWHEIATGSGWSAFEMFPELASAFSPEDVFSNALGTLVGADVVLDGAATSEGAYNEALTKRLAAVLDRLGAVPPDTTRAVLKELDGTWWDSTQRLPSSKIALKRSFDIGPRVKPLEIPRATAGKWCNGRRASEVVHLPTSVGGRRIEDFATLYVKIAADERVRLPGVTPPWITQRSFPKLIEAVKIALAKAQA
jgi:hypothetical protein